MGEPCFYCQHLRCFEALKERIMSIHIFDSRLIQAAMLRMCVGVLFVGLAVTAHTAQSEEDSSAPDLNILSVQLARADAELPTYQLNANVAVSRSSVIAPGKFGFGKFGLFNSPPSHLSTNPETLSAQVPSTQWRQTDDNYLVSLQRHLSVEFKFGGGQTNIALQPHSIVIYRERVKITFRPQSALIENGQFKIMFQPHSASVTWAKTF